MPQTPLAWLCQLGEIGQLKPLDMPLLFSENVHLLLTFLRCATHDLRCRSQYTLLNTHGDTASDTGAAILFATVLKCYNSAN